MALKKTVRILELEKSEGIEPNADNKYKEAVFALLEHFKDQLGVTNGEVVDPYSGARPKLICKLEV